MVRRLLQRCDLADAQRFKGQQVELFWPEDATWWLARIIKVSPASGTLSVCCAVKTVVLGVRALPARYNPTPLPYLMLQG